MFKTGGNIFTRVVVSIFSILITLALLFVVAVLIYCAVKGITFSVGFKEVLGFLIPNAVNSTKLKINVWR